MQPNEGTDKSPRFVNCTCHMITAQLIESIAREHLEGTPLTLVEVSVSEDNDIEIVITRSDEGVSIDDCMNLSRFVESRLDRDKEDFSLTVASAGI